MGIGISDAPREACLCDFREVSRYVAGAPALFALDSADLGGTKGEKTVSQVEQTKVH